jgi:hypothetical protein
VKFPALEVSIILFKRFQFYNLKSIFFSKAVDEVGGIEMHKLTRVRNKQPAHFIVSKGITLKLKGLVLESFISQYSEIILLSLSNSMEQNYS